MFPPKCYPEAERKKLKKKQADYCRSSHNCRAGLRQQSQTYSFGRQLGRLAPDNWLVKLDVWHCGASVNCTGAFCVKGMSIVIPACAGLDIRTKSIEHLVGHVAEKPVRDRNQTWSRRSMTLAQMLGRVLGNVRLDRPFPHGVGYGPLI